LRAVSVNAQSPATQSDPVSIWSDRFLGWRNPFLVTFLWGRFGVRCLLTVAFVRLRFAPSLFDGRRHPSHRQDGHRGDREADRKSASSGSHSCLLRRLGIGDLNRAPTNRVASHATNFSF